MDRLRKYSALQRALLTIPQELKRLELEAASLRGDTMSPIGGCLGRGRREHLLLNNIVQQQELRRALEQAELFVKVTDQAFEILQPEEAQLLEQLYIHPKWGNANQMTAEMDVSKSTFYKRRERALKKFTLALYGKS